MKIKLSKVWKEQIALILCFWYVYGLLKKYLNPDIFDSELSMMFFILLIVFGIGYSIGEKTYWD